MQASVEFIDRKCPGTIANDLFFEKRPLGRIPDGRPVQSHFVWKGMVLTDESVNRRRIILETQLGEQIFKAEMNLTHDEAPRQNVNNQVKR